MKVLEKHKKTIASILGWLFAYFFIGGLVGYLLFVGGGLLFTWERFFSVFGGYSSFFGLIVMLVQFKSVRETTEDTIAKLDNVSLISEWSKAVELIRGAETDIERDDFTVACYKIKSVKDIVIRTKSVDSSHNTNEDCNLVVAKLNSIVSSVSYSVLDENEVINKQGLSETLEGVADFLNERINKHKNRI